MPLRITGMNSGLDTETIVKELVKGQSAKVDKLKKEQKKLEWKQEAWKELNTKVKNLFNKTITNLRWSSSYMKKTTTVSNSSAVSVITGENAVNGVQTLEIGQQAKTGYLTGKQLSKDGKYTALTKLSDLDSDSFKNGETGVINIKSGGKTTAIEVSGDTTISDVLTKLKSAGVNASFDEKNQRFFIVAKESGEEADFALTASDGTGQKALEAMGINAALKDDKATLEEYKEYASYYVDGDRDATLANMKSLIQAETDARVAAYKSRNEAIVKSVEDLDKKMDALKAKDGYDASATEDSLQGKIDTLKEEIENETDEDAKKTKQEELTKLESQLADVKQLKSYEEKKTKLQEEKTVNDSYVDTDADGNVTAKDKLKDEITNAFYNKAEYAKSAYDAYLANPDAAGGATRVAGQNAIIYLNDAEFTSKNNVFDVNGLTMTILSDTKEKVTITTQEDTQGVYDMVKNFLKEYNALVNEMDKLYNAEAAKGYEPLTDEEKAELSESDAEKWEQKIKDSLLRRDSSLNSVSNTLVNIMAEGVEVDGKRMFLSNFGISTLSYFEAADNEKHAYHIDGDPDDEATGGNADKLKSMIASDPETVSKFFMGLAEKMNDAWSSMRSTNALKSFNSVYNDKSMKEQYDSYKDKIAKQEELLTQLEDKWYNKFTAMETALAKLQSNQTAVSSLLGGL